MLDTDKREYIYQMYKLGKTLDNGKKLLDNINLSFYPGAKIGVLGNNGSGKSTLMKVMAGVDDRYDGDAAPARWAKIGYLQQEPELTEDATVLENIEEAVKETRDLLNDFNDLSKKARTLQHTAPRLRLRVQRLLRHLLRAHAAARVCGLVG